MIFFRAPLKPRVLSFDLDNTIYDCESVLRAAERWFALYLCERYRLGEERCRDYRFWGSVKRELARSRPELENDVTTLRVLSLIEAFRRLGRELPADEAGELLRVFVRKRSQGTLDPQMRACLLELGKRYPLCALSNGNLDTAVLGVERIFRTDFRPALPAPRRKPFPDLFLNCARRFNVEPREILHIGDDPLTDVTGAAEAGCMSCWVYRGYSGISEDERSLGAVPTLAVRSVLELPRWLLAGT